MKRVALSAGISFLAATLVASLLAGCGGGEKTTSQGASAEIPAEANANCRQLRREAVQLAHGAFKGSDNPTEAATRYIIRPSIPLLERFAASQQMLAKGSGDKDFELYGRLFEPVIVLAQERLRSGEESSSPFNSAARGFEILLTTVVDEQRQAARKAGLAACSIDFQKVLRNALRG